MSQKEDLSEVTVGQTLNSWELDRGKGASQCERRLLSALLLSVLLIFFTIASLVCAFWLLIYPQLTTRGTGDKFAAHLRFISGDDDGTVKWSATTGMGWNYLGSGFRFENQELQTTRDGMYYVYAKLRVSCAVLNQCNSSLVKLDITHCSESNGCSSILSMKAQVTQGKQQQQAAFDYSGTVVRVSSKAVIRARIEGLRKDDNVIPDIDDIYFGAFLIES